MLGLGRPNLLIILFLTKQARCAPLTHVRNIFGRLFPPIVLLVIASDWGPLFGQVVVALMILISQPGSDHMTDH